MDQLIARICIICGQTLQVKNDQGTVICPRCSQEYIIKGQILQIQGKIYDNSLLDRVITISKGNEILKKRKKKTYTRLQKLDEDFRETSTKDILSEGITLWSDSMFQLILPWIIFSILLFLINGLNSSFDARLTVAETLSISTDLDWTQNHDFISKILPLMFIPLFNPVEYLYGIFLTLAMGYFLLVLHQTVNNTETNPLNWKTQLSKFIKRSPQLIILGFFLTFFELLLYEGPKYLFLTSIDYSNTANYFISTAFSIYLLFPIYLIVKIWLFQAIPSCVLGETNDFQSLKHSERLSRGRYRKIFSIFLIRNIVVFGPAIILSRIEYSFILPNAEPTIFNFIQLMQAPDPFIGILVIPLILLSLTFMLSWQLILFIESQKKWQANYKYIIEEEEEL